MSAWPDGPALLDHPDLGESIAQMRRGEGRVLRPLGGNDATKN
jgi:hypothetical protein